MANRLSDRLSRWDIVLVIMAVAMAFVVGAIVVSAFEGGWLVAYHGGQNIRSAYDQCPLQAQVEIFRLTEIFSSESYKQADADVQSSASATLEEFLLQFGPALDKAKKTGETGYLDLLRARISADKDTETLRLRDLGLL